MGDEKLTVTNIPINICMKKIAMIGCGKLGLDCAEVMAEQYNVVGYDIEPKTPLNFPMVNSIQDAVEGKDIIFIAAPTPHDPMYGGETPTSHLPNKDFDYSILIDILKEVNKYLNNQLVVIISTVLPGTMRTILCEHITHGRLIYNPYLIAMGTVKYDMVNPEMVIIGTNNGSVSGDANELIEFYKPIIKNDCRYEIGTWDEAEAIKIFYNTFISTKLALVNMIQDVAETGTNINVDVVTNALAKSTQRIMGPAYMKAGLGDAGACHPRDNIALRYLAEKLDLGYDLFDSIMTAREVQAERMAKRCLTFGPNVTIIGKAYKPSVPYTNGSASMLIGHYVEQHGGEVNYYDLNTGDAELKPDWTHVYLIGYWEPWVERIQFPPHSVVIDPWRNITDRQSSGEIIHYGNTRVVHIPQEPILKRQQESTQRVLDTLPYLQKLKDHIYVVPVSLDVDNFYVKSSEYLFNNIKANHDRGKHKIIFEALGVELDANIILKINRLIKALSKYTRFTEFLYITSKHSDIAKYQDICNRLNLPNNLIVIETEIDKGTEFLTELNFRNHRELSEITYNYTDINPSEAGSPPTELLEYSKGRLVNIPTTWITDSMLVPSTYQLSNGTEISFPNFIKPRIMKFELDQFAHIIRNHERNTFSKALHWCCGTGIDGFELLIKNIAEHVTFVDQSAHAIEAIKENAKRLGLENRITAIVSPMICNLPDTEKYNLVIGNPPTNIVGHNFFPFVRHYQTQSTKTMEEIANEARIHVDHKLSIRKEFFTNIGDKLNNKAHLFLLEYAAHSECMEWADQNGLKYMNSYQINESPHIWIMHYRLF